ncbi:polysaccharide deacetylase family protein [Actinoallomurus soli]|uniref:polysaccharide deacetylase family protein n=1 Tax=Actinoallomurus soli TaxID=2952535 RepID=UPI0020928847|nr:polysaccharide deacetylase family protein [Actinoallomurus soli]MCO5972012.1 polysaccharide deacetylase family protein [Actinoallomurus soli]
MTTRGRVLAELGLGVGLLGLAAGLAVDVLSPASKADTEKARTVVTNAMLQAARTDNRCTRGRVALTFDDGPDIYTPQILKVLRAYGVRATFFAMGQKAAARPALIRAEVADGHLVENHSWNHPHMADLDQAQIDWQLNATQRAITAAGAPAPTLFRPPFGNTNTTVDGEAKLAGMRVIRWSIDTDDWRGREPGDIAASVLDQVVPGSVVLMHDGVRQSAATVQALPTVIRGLRARGFCTALATD